jgi:hypothetical protein
MNLEPAAQSLLEQFPSGGRADLARREARLEKFGGLAFAAFLCILFFAVVGLLYAILDRFVFSGNNPLVGILMMMFIIFGMLGLAYVFLREDLKAKRKKGPSDEVQRDVAPPLVTARLIEEREFEPIPSVVEDTTDLLPSRHRDRQ